MIEISSVWEGVERLVSPPLKPLIPGLRAFLSGLENPHARLLSGEVPAKPVGQDSATELTQLVIDQYGKQLSSKQDVADWLRLLYAGERALNKAGHDLAYTSLVALTTPKASPFTPDAMVSAHRAALWRKAFANWVKTVEPPLQKDAWQVAVVVSAVLHGFMLDITKLKGLVSMLGEDLNMGYAAGYAYLEFDLPYQGMGNHHLQRWFLDPVSELLLLRMPRDGTNIEISKLGSRLRRFMRNIGIAKEQCPAGLADFVTSATAWWNCRSAQIDIHAMRRSFSTHAIHLRTWRRMFSQATSHSQRTRSEDAFTKANTAWDVVDEMYLLHPWFMALSQQMAPNAPEVREAVEQYVQSELAEENTDELRQLALGWLRFLLAGNSASKDAIAYSTIRRRYLAAAPVLLAMAPDILGVLQGSESQERKTEVLEDFYLELILERDPDLPVEDLAKGIADFHAYLVKTYGIKHIGNMASVLGDDLRLLPVDANLITFEDYRAAWNLFDERMAKGRDPDDTIICKLVMALAFKLGMRRMEILGLRLEDMQLERGMTCVVRPHDQRRLKTASSRRNMPMAAFLDWRERKLLKKWFYRRRQEEGREALPPGSIRSRYLFARVDGEAPQEQVSVEGVVDRIIEVLRGVTGDQAIFLHHLRHAFGTWTYLRLCAPDYPLVAEFFVGQPETSQAIRQGKRLRHMVLGERRSPSRVFAFAVARLLGHSSPAMSMAHYIHCSDVFQAALVYREAGTLPAEVLVAAAGLPESTARRHLGLTVHQLVVMTRKKLRPQNESAHAVDEMPESEPRVRGRRKNVPAHKQVHWMPLENVRAILHLTANGGYSPQEVASQLGLPQARVNAALEGAMAWGKFLALETGKHGVSKPPNLFRYAREKRFAEELEERVATLHSLSPQKCIQGIELHLKRYNRQKHDVVFRDAAELTAYLSFLQGLGFGAESFVGVVRRAEGASKTPPGWVGAARAKWLPAKIKRIAPATATKPGAYARMFGLLPVDNSGMGLGQVMASMLFLARVGLMGRMESNSDKPSKVGGASQGVVQESV